MWKESTLSRLQGMKFSQAHQTNGTKHFFYLFLVHIIVHIGVSVIHFVWHKPNIRTEQKDDGSETVNKSDYFILQIPQHSSSFCNRASPFLSRSVSFPMSPSPGSNAAAEDPQCQTNHSTPAEIPPGLQDTALGHTPPHTPHVNLTREQIDARFALEQRRIEADLAATEARTARENEESRARVAALQSGAVVATTPRTPVYEEDWIEESSQETLLVARRYPGLPKAEIALIFSNRFRPRSLHRLRHFDGREEKDHDENTAIKDDCKKTEPVMGTLRDFGSTFGIWSECFINYCMIMMDFFGAAFPTLFRVLLLFHNKIQELSEIYEWQNAVLPLAIDYHASITAGNHTDVKAWTLPQHWIDHYCASQYNLNVPPSKKRALNTSSEWHMNKKRVGEVCRNFNTKGCSFQKCAREHRCTECNSKEHGAYACIHLKRED